MVDFLHAEPPQFRKFFRHAVELAGIVPLAPEGLRGHVGTVGFQHDPVQRDGCCYLQGLSGILKVSTPVKPIYQPRATSHLAISPLPE